MRMFKKVAAMIMAVAMLCSFTALGAEVTIAPIADVTNAEGAPTVEVSYEATTGIDVTVLAYEGTDLKGANLVYIDQLTAGSEVDFALDSAAPFGTYTVTMGGTDVTTAATQTFNYTDDTPKYDIVVAAAENGYVACDTANLKGLKAGTKINFEFTPFMGYKLTSLMVGETESITAVKNGKFTLEVSASATVTAVFTAVEADADGDVFTASNVYDIAADADAELEKEQGKSKLTFGKAVEVAGKNARNMGMYVQVWDDEKGEYVDFKTPKGVGPHYRATNPINNQYGIRFFSFEAGKYQVRSYVQYEDAESGELGETIYGDYVEFTVE